MEKKIKIILMIFSGILNSQHIDYQTQIQPIFDQSCTNCHGSSGGLALGSFDQLMSGGNSGDVVIPGDYLNSILWQRIDSGDMPPVGDLSSNQMELIEDWITQGALEEVLDSEIIDVTPEVFNLFQNYPNPFNPITNIKYSIKEYGYISLIIYDLNGFYIKSLFNNYSDAGSYSVRWDSTDENGSKMSSGIYIYKLVSNTINESKKMILLK